MRAAVVRYANGQPARLPYRVMRQLVAQTYGQSPAAIDEWPADDFTDAAQLIGVGQ